MAHGTALTVVNRRSGQAVGKGERLAWLGLAWLQGESLEGLNESWVRSRGQAGRRNRSGN
jgi:hypothetical protein